MSLKRLYGFFFDPPSTKQAKPISFNLAMPVDAKRMILVGIAIYLGGVRLINA